jgi:hypothetical protein
MTAKENDLVVDAVCDDYEGRHVARQKSISLSERIVHAARAPSVA